jgi:hypothetical protein
VLLDRLGWIHEYGVLGVLPGSMEQFQRDQTTDSFSEFVQEVLLANQTLRLFEASTNPDGLEIETAQELLPEQYGRRVDDDHGGLERVALQAVGDTIE